MRKSTYPDSLGAMDLVLVMARSRARFDVLWSPISIDSSTPAFFLWSPSDLAQSTYSPSSTYFRAQAEYMNDNKNFRIRRRMHLVSVEHLEKNLQTILAEV
jgi:hypothetical protein